MVAQPEINQQPASTTRQIHEQAGEHHEQIARRRRNVADGLANALVNPKLREMASFNIYDAKTQLSKLIRRVRAGQEVVIADAGTPVAKLVPIEPPKAPRVLGSDRGKIWAAPDAFDPLAGEELTAWDGALFPEAPKPQPRPPARRPASRRGARRPARR